MTAIAAQAAALHVPMNDLRLQYARIRDEIDQALARVMEDCSFILGPRVQAFEEAYAAYCGVRHCIGVSNGTDALKLGLLACGVGEGDEVITAPLTFGATLEAICQVGARPVLADIHPEYYTLDPQQVRRCLSERTRAIVPVHLYGQVADMEPLWEMARERGLAIVEDAAQAHGAMHQGRRAGALGQVGCFSFYPGKNLGAYGDAGGLTTDDEVLARRLYRLRNHGQAERDKFAYGEVGFNHRMDGFQGAVLGAKLPHLDQWNQRRREIAGQYRAGLEEVGPLTLPAEAPYGQHAYHLFAVRVPDRDLLAASLQQEGVQTAVHYPYPLHLTQAYRFLGYQKGDLPVCERVCEQILSLPIFPEMSDAQVDWVIDRIRWFYA